MADIATLGIQVKMDGVAQANRGLGELEKGAGRAEKAATSMGGAFEKVASVLGVAISISAIKNAADNWSDMNSRLAITVGDADKAAVAMDRLGQVAKSTYSDISATTESFIANAGVLKELGKSTNQALDYTEALNNALVVSGAKGQRAASVQDALSKAMAGGKLSGQNLNTVIETGGRVAEVLAAELGISTLQLRKFGAEGKITSAVIYNALTKRMKELREQAESMPATMGDAATAIGNAFTTIVGKIDQATGSSEALAQTIYDYAYQVAGYGDTIAQAFVVGQGAISAALDFIIGKFNEVAGGAKTSGALMAVGIGLGTTAALGFAAVLMGPVLAAIGAVSAAILLNPVGLLVGAFASAVAAAYIFRDDISEIMGSDFPSAAKDAVNRVIGMFVGAYNVIVAHWEKLPTVFSGIGKQAWNAFLEQFKTESLWVEAFGTRYTLFEGLNLDKFKATLSDAEKTVTTTSNTIMADAAKVDYVGKIGEGVGAAWTEAGESMKKFANLNDAGKAAAGANEISKSAKKAADAYAELLRSAQQRVQQMEQEVQLVGMNSIAADVLRMKLDMLHQAQEKGLKLSQAQKEQLNAQADAYGRAAQKVAELTLMEDARFARAQLGRSAIEQQIASDLKNAGIEMDSVAGQAYASYAKLTDAISTAKTEAKSFASSFISDLLNGKSATESLIGALKKLGDKLIDMALDEMINGLFKNLLGILGGGGGGGWMGASYFPPAPTLGGGMRLYADGGISNKPAIFGEAGPEAAVPLPDGRSIPVTLNNGGGKTGGDTIKNEYNFTGTQKEFEQFQKFVMERDRQFDARAQRAVINGQKKNKGYN